MAACALHDNNGFVEEEFKSVHESELVVYKNDIVRYRDANINANRSDESIFNTVNERFNVIHATSMSISSKRFASNRSNNIVYIINLQ